MNNLIEDYDDKIEDYLKYVVKEFYFYMLFSIIE